MRPPAGGREEGEAPRAQGGRHKHDSTGKARDANPAKPGSRREAAPAPVTWSTLVVQYIPRLDLPHLRSLPLTYDRQRALITEGGVHLLMRASVVAAERPDQVTGIMLGVNWFVYLAQDGLIQFTADTPMIDVIVAQIAHPDLSSYQAVTRRDWGTECPEWFVA